MVVAKAIRVMRAALDEDGEDIVLRGVIHPQSLAELQVAEYQRETLAEPKIERLKQALRTGRVPDVDLGMRGQRHEERPGGIFLLRDPIFIVDGLQRVTAGRRLLEETPPIQPHIGATIHFDTTEEWERQRFEDLNLGQTKLSSNVTLRNQRERYAAVAMLWRLTHDPNFVLCDRVTWAQAAKRGELLSATMLLHTMGRLHAHLGPGRYTNVLAACEGVQRIMDRVGSSNFEDNIRTFFEIIEQAWGIRRVAYREGAVYMRTTFLRALAHLFSEHLDFWQGERLVVATPLARKLGQFPTSDPHVMSLASASGKAIDILINLLVDHLNKGRQVRHLRPRPDAERYRGDDEAID